MNPPPTSNTIRPIEWFAGIGGFHCALMLEDMGDFERCSQPIAIDIHQGAKQVYSANFNGRYLIQSIESMTVKKADQLGIGEGNLWWMSPPCQPFTRRGNQRQETDPRNAAFENVLMLLKAFQPKVVCLENVPEFFESQPYRRLVGVLQENSFQISARYLCPTQFGIPMKRKRFFLVASKSESKELQDFDHLVSKRPMNNDRLMKEVSQSKSLRAYLLPDQDPRLLPLVLQDEVFEKYQEGMNVIEVEDQDRFLANCFTKAYGKSFTKSGSFLRCPGGRVRRFHPMEMLRLFGFPENFLFPEHLNDRQKFALIGNGLSVHCLRQILRKLKINRLCQD